MDRFKPQKKKIHKPVAKEDKIILYDPRDVIDHSFKVSNINEFIKEKTPFVYLRYNDGEWRALLGREVWDRHWKNTGNGDKHQFYNGMMRNLRQVLSDISKLDKNKHNIFVGLHGTWDQKEIQQYVVDNNLKDTIHWVGTIRPEEGVYDLTFLEFLNLIKDNKDICKVLITKNKLKPMAKRINADYHLGVAELNSYEQYNTYFKRCIRICNNETRPILFMSSMGPSCNILGFRLYEYRNDIMYFNTGSVFDPFLGLQIRGYMRRPDFVTWFKEHYKDYLD